MGHKNIILELNNKKNVWTPPVIPEMEMAYSVRYDVNASQSTDYLYIFRTEPYIDSIYIEYNHERVPVIVKRFAIHNGYTWDRESEIFFHIHCVKEPRCTCSCGQIDRVFSRYNELRPEWHLKRYYTKEMRLLDHIYNCIKGNTAKEILYKAGLDELAVHIDEIDELNLLASKPSDMYDGLSMKVLRSVNCHEGAMLVNKAMNRDFLKNLNMKFTDLFENKLNDAQCRYLHFLIRGDLTLGEAGRLFRSRKPDLAQIWTKSLYDNYMEIERVKRKRIELYKIYGSIDPIYENYIKDMKNIADNYNLKQLEFFLIRHREEYDRKIRRSNRKRNYEWQERGKDYIVRYPQTINDFCRESIYMQNCLLTYVEALVKNDTTIMFVRKAENVNQPYITMEIYSGELMQAYHRFNEDCTPEEASWIINYCKRHGIKTGKFRFNADIDELF